MRYYLLFVMMFAGWFVGPALADDGAMIVDTRNGEKILFLFDEKPEMAFAGDVVEIRSSKETVQFQMAEVAQIYFEEGTSGIDNAGNNAVAFRMAGSRMEISGLSPSETVSVYSVGGTLLQRANADASGSAVLETGKLPAGLLVVRTDKITYKLLKKN